MAKKCASLGMEALALTDHGRCGGLLALKEECKKVEIRPIYGCELYVAPESRLTRGKLDNHIKTSYHLTVLAKNEIGLRNVFRLTSIGWLDGFYYKPRVDLEVLKENSEGLVVLSGCASGRLSAYILEGRDPEEIDSHIIEMRDTWKDDFYIEVQNHKFDWQAKLKEVLFNISKAYDIPIVATQDAHYLERKNADLHRAICKLTAGDLEFAGEDLYLKSHEEMLEVFDKTEHHAITRTKEVADKCNCVWKHDKTIWPAYDLPEGKTADEALEELTYAGLTERFGEATEEYRQRVVYELRIIKEMGFSTYFLVVADFINWAKAQKIPCGPGRGSAAGSLVCYCMGITDIDPIKYNLYFERFLNPSRVSLPDADIDVCKRRRSEVIAYIQNKYGEDRVAQIGTYSEFKPRGSLRDFARVMGYSPNVRGYLAKMIPPDAMGKSLSFDECIKLEPGLLKTDYPEVIDLARRAEKLITKTGIHAAGIVISNDEIMNYAPLFRGKHDEIATQFNMGDVESIGLVKLDLLGLKNLTVIQDTVDLVKKYTDLDIDIWGIDREDQKVFKNIFCKGRLDGIFQFETSSGIQDLCVQIKPKSLEDLSIINALHRPGPLKTGLTQEYAERRGGKEFEYDTEVLEKSLESTYGIMVYQEQIMALCMDLAGYTLPEADNMRKIIGKKLPDKMKLEREKFVSGCIKNNIPESAASELFENIEGFADYSFNKSHSLSYSLISYQTAWLKYYYPVEFYCALFNSSLDDQDDLVKYFHACREEGISIYPPDINKSDSLFKPEQGTIIFGFAGIKGIGEKACEELLEKRPEKGFQSLDDILEKNVHSRTIRALAECGSLSSISEYGRGSIVEALPKLVEHQKKIKAWEERKERFEERERERQAAIDKGEKPPRKRPKLPERPEKPEIDKEAKLAKEDRLKLERETLGFYITGHPLDQYTRLLSIHKNTIERIKNEALEGNVALPGVIYSITEKRTKKNKNMATMILEDKTGRIETIIFPSIWKKTKGRIEEGDVVIVSGNSEIKEINDDTPVIARLIAKKITKVEKEEKMTNIVLKLEDNATIEFVVDDRTDYNSWQRAKAIVNNLGAN
jgi:DNA polymerase-3 subunit alpha